ncbi:hypothetical protein M427DRAFT_56433 [Gonapodya prolifera JEL478]|uniref:Cytochrome c oxidase assembly factor 6 n=1 Tax=Gonapodya prolifera (strain JEL478) TaxID=1344416 RepID=A0A139AGC4_GONPJ|nr:hypothetical protein M427DRAFT_56433 [Gonapodya prolifera JEL478]|eukprot:KXS15861.1 hypothetical protein M427DRAFT_56433 [Gonapodya prolifera JEL478]
MFKYIWPDPPAPPPTGPTTDHTKAPDRSLRKKCWDARDEYWECLDRNGLWLHGLRPRPVGMGHAGGSGDKTAQGGTAIAQAAEQESDLQQSADQKLRENPFGTKPSSSSSSSSPPSSPPSSTSPPSPSTPTTSTSTSTPAPPCHTPDASSSSSTAPETPVEPARPSVRINRDLTEDEIRKLSVCEEFKTAFERECLPSWVEHFNSKRLADMRMARLQQEAEREAERMRVEMEEERRKKGGWGRVFG